MPQSRPTSVSATRQPDHLCPPDVAGWRIAMLTSEEARQRLQPWLIDPNADGDEEGDENALLVRIVRLVKPLRTAAYALLDRDADGKAITGRDWQQNERRKDAALTD